MLQGRTTVERCQETVKAATRILQLPVWVQRLRSGNADTPVCFHEIKQSTKRISCHHRVGIENGNVFAVRRPDADVIAAPVAEIFFTGDKRNVGKISATPSFEALSTTIIS